VLVLALARSWRPTRQASFEGRRYVEDQLLAQVAQVCLQYGATKVSTDQYAAQPVIDRLTREGLHVEAVPMSATSKTQAFAELRARLYNGTLELYENDDLLAELRRLRSKFTAGSASVVNPRVGGSHGDMAQALALACLDRQQHVRPAAARSGPRPAAARGGFDGGAWLDRYGIGRRGWG
jgi:hypothetical protein